MIHLRHKHSVLQNNGEKGKQWDDHSYYWSFGTKTAFSDSCRVRRGTMLSFEELLRTFRRFEHAVALIQAISRL